MSVINEALKQAQRERSERAGQPAAGALADSFFPYPTGQKRRGTNVALVIGVVVVLGLVAAGVAVVRLRTTPPVPPATHPAVTTPVAGIAAAPSPTAVAPTDSAPARGAAPTRALPVQPPAVAKANVPDGPPTPSPTHNRSSVAPAAGSRVQRADAAPVPAAAPVLPQTENPAAVRIVLDARTPVRPADSLFNQAYAEQLRNNVDRAIELYEKSIALPGAPSGAYNNYGALLRQRGNQVAATEMFQLALQHDDKNVQAWINLGDSYNAAGHHAEAMSAFARALQLDPSSGAVKIRLAFEYLAIGDTAGARRTYEDGVRVAPRDANVHYGYGMFLQQQRDYRGAIREYQQFVDLAQERVDAKTVDDVRKHIALLRKYAP